MIGLDTPEMQGQCPAERAAAVAARDRLAALVAEGVNLQPRGRDRYRRLLAVVRLPDGRDAATVLITEGHARPYNGRTRRLGWCGVG
jgi:endonuclease YncB( thermonuclease family)